MPIDKILEETEDENKKILIQQIVRITSYLNMKSENIFLDEIESLELPKVIEEIPDELLNAKLNQFTNNVKKNRRLGSNTINVFLAVTFLETKKEYRVIQARLFLITAYLKSLNGYDEVINRALIQFRLLADGQNWNLLDRFPDFKKTESEIVKDLIELKNYKKKDTKVKEEEQEELTGHEKIRLQNIIALFEQYIIDKPGYEKKGRRRKKNEKQISTENVPEVILEEINNHIPYETDESSIIEIIPRSKSSNDTKSEILSDEERESRFFSINFIEPEDVLKSYSLMKETSKAIINNSQRRQKLLTTDVLNLSSHQVQKIIRFYLEKNEIDIHDCCLLIMLFCGKNLEESLKCIEQVKITKNHSKLKKNAVVESKIPLTEFNLDKKINSKIEESSGSVFLLLPPFLRKSLIKFRGKFKDINDIEKNIEITLNEINKETSHKITTSKISSYLIFYLNKKRIDPIEITHILNKGLRSEPGTYYYLVDSGKLLRIHQNYINDLLSDFEGEEILKIDESPEKPVGSQLVFKQELILELFQLLSQALESKRDSGWHGYEEFHNLYVIYNVLLLNLSTGHRPVNDMYDDISNFDLIAGTLLISDKNVRDDLISRVIGLPKLSIKQVGLYLEHLKIISSIISDISNETGKNIQSAIQGKFPLFFFIQDNQIVRITPKQLTNFCEDIFPVPLNWNRHFIRTWLRRKNFSGEWVNAWMGHQSLGSVGFSRYSGLSIFNMKEIAHSIHDLLTTQLMIKNVEPWRINK